MADRDVYGYDAYDGYGYQRAPQHPAARYAPTAAPAPESAMGNTGFVRGVIALRTSFIQLVNTF